MWYHLSSNLALEDLKQIAIIRGINIENVKEKSEIVKIIERYINRQIQEQEDFRYAQEIAAENTPYSDINRQFQEEQRRETERVRDIVRAREREIKEREIELREREIEIREREIREREIREIREREIREWESNKECLHMDDRVGVLSRTFEKKGRGRTYTIKGKKVHFS
tara:strand:- start:678 stop:1184 length:507 start_codon:yes stop_codon:yes gene_type:complete